MSNEIKADFDGEIYTIIARLCPEDKAQLDRIEAMVKPMKWTDRKPCIVGHYWYRETPTTRAAILYARDGMVFSDKRPVKITDCSGQWAGPIPEPGE